MRRPSRPILGLAAVALVGALGASGEASAQQAAGQARGLRYLSWPGRAETPDPAGAAPVSTTSRRDLRRSNRVIPHGGAAETARPSLTPAPGPARRTLTPASAWLHPQPAPAESPPPPVEPPPSPVLAPPAPRAVALRPVPEYLPDQGGQPTPADIAYPAAAAPPADDPMAPRPDAPIFRMQSPTPATRPRPEPAASTDGEEDRPADPRRVALVTPNAADHPATEGARYYSVHRLAGRQPDAVELPQPTYIDALQVDVAALAAGPDLAEPQQGPTLIRDAQGRLRPQPAAPEGDYQ